MQKSVMAKKKTTKIVSESNPVDFFFLTPAICLTLIAIVSFLCYSNTFNASFHLDDTLSITENEAIQAIDKKGAKFNFSYRRYLTFLSFSLNYYFNGLDVFGYHLVNLVVHTMTSMSLFWFIRLLLSSPEGIKNIRNKAVDGPPPDVCFWMVPLFAALLFAAHPIQTQTVTYISQRAASLATLFYILSMIFYVKAAIKHHEGGKFKAFFLLLSFVMAISAMFTKEIAFTLPLAILLIEFFFFSSSWSGIKARASSSPSLLMAVAAIPMVMMAIHKVDIGDIGRLTFETESISRWQYLLTQFNVIRTYIRLLFLPVYQNLDYDYPVSLVFFELSTVLSFLFLSAIIISGVFLFKKERLISFGLFFFFLALSLESSIIPIKDVIFEHRLYLPMIGFAAAFSMGLLSLLRLFSINGKCGFVFKWYLYLSCTVIIVAGIAAYTRNRVWKDDLSLWGDAASKSPEKLRPQYNMGNTYLALGRFDEAVSHYNKALRIKPDFPRTHNNLGNAKKRQGKIDEAVNHYSQALRFKPDDAEAHYNMGIVLEEQGKSDEAVFHYSEALRITPDFPSAHNNFGNVLLGQGKLAEAVTHYKEALKLSPDYAEAHYNLGNAFIKQNKFVHATAHYAEAIRIKPDYSEAYNNLGGVLAKMGRWEEAIREWKNSLAIDPDNRAVQKNLKAAKQRMGGVYKNTGLNKF